MFLTWALTSLISFYGDIKDHVCLHKCWKCQDAEDSCLWKFDSSQPQNFDTFDCDIACTGEPDPDRPCVERCDSCQDAHNSCLWEFDPSQAEDFDTFDCDQACNPECADQPEVTIMGNTADCPSTVAKVEANGYTCETVPNVDLSRTLETDCPKSCGLCGQTEEDGQEDRRMKCRDSDDCVKMEDRAGGFWFCNFDAEDWGFCESCKEIFDAEKSDCADQGFITKKGEAECNGICVEDGGYESEE